MLVFVCRSRADAGCGDSGDGVTGGVRLGDPVTVAVPLGLAVPVDECDALLDGEPVPVPEAPNVIDGEDVVDEDGVAELVDVAVAVVEADHVGVDVVVGVPPTVTTLTFWICIPLSVVEPNGVP